MAISTKKIEELKEQWKSDPIWDIEDTEGFEAYYDELRSFRLQYESELEKKDNERLLEKSKQLGIEGNIALTKHIESLENRISHLIEDVNELSYKIN
tara:strand:+ start:12297 stop:12587 length:291 start_codon:yes stop_codon:yes gene_type:complete